MFVLSPRGDTERAVAVLVRLQLAPGHFLVSDHELEAVGAKFAPVLGGMYPRVIPVSFRYQSYRRSELRSWRLQDLLLMRTCYG